MGKIWNRIVNTLGIAPRTIKTASRTTIDTTKSALNVVLDPFIGLGKTGKDIKQAIHKSFTEGPWYRKLWKAPASLALTPFMAIEGVAETLRGTGVNACSSVRDIVGNTLTNEGNAIKMMGKSEKFNFTTDKLEYKKISPRNRLASLFRPKNETDLERESFKDKEKDLKEQEKKVKELKEKESERIKSEEAKLQKEKESLAKEKENRLNERKKERESWQEARKSEQEKYSQSAKQEREKFNKEKEDLNKRIAILEQEKKDLESTLKKTSTEPSKDKETSVPKPEKKPESKSEKKSDSKPESKPEVKEKTSESSKKPDIKEAA